MVNNEARINYLVFAPCALGPLSILGSSLILISIARSRLISGRSSNKRRGNSSSRRRNSKEITTTKQLHHEQPLSIDNNNNNNNNNAKINTTTSTSTTTQRNKKIIQNRRQKQSKTKVTTYHRLLGGIAILDILLSIGLTLGPLPVPSDLNLPIQGNHGNIATCNIQGFLLQLGYGSFYYSSMLMVYYVLVVRYNIKEITIATKIEPFMHIVGISFHLGTAILGLPLKVYNPQGGGLRCWVGTSPPGCEYPESNIDCERGEKYEPIFGLWLATVPYLIYVAINIFCLIIVTITVWWKYVQSQRFTFLVTATAATRPPAPAPAPPPPPPAAAETTASDVVSAGYCNTDTTNRNASSCGENGNCKNSNVSRRCSSIFCYYHRKYLPGSIRNSGRVGSSSSIVNSSSLSSPQHDRMKLVVTQSILYGVVYLNVAIWGTLGTIFYLAGVEMDILGRHYWIMFLGNTFFPVHGFLYFLIFIRPSYLRVRKRQLDTGIGTRWNALREAIWKESSLSSSTSSSNNQHHPIRHDGNNNPRGSSNGGTIDSGNNINNLHSATATSENHHLQDRHDRSDEVIATTAAAELT